MSGYVSSYFEQYQGPIGCGSTLTPATEESNCLLYVIVGVVALSLLFSKKKAATK